MQRVLMILVLASIACLFLTVASGSGDDTSNITAKGPVAGESTSMRVLWTVASYKLTKSATWDDDQAKAMVFKPLDIDKTSITFDHRTCSDVSFDRQEVKTAAYLERRYQVTPQWLGIDDDVVQVTHTDCGIPGFSEYIQLKNGRLVLFMEGVFFFLEPNVNY